jgi:MFS transporter, UMF1 family
MTPERRKAWAWALYDWANSAFATTVMAGFFPLFFKDYWAAGADATVSTFRLGAANSAQSVALALLAPVLGAIADRGAARKRFLGFFAGLGVGTTALLFFVPSGAWGWAAALYILAGLGFGGSLVFYDALLVDVSPENRMHRVSALGYSLGYLGGGLLFALNVLMTLQPGLFGLSDATQAVRLSFLSVALWWALFSLPLFRYVEEPRSAGAKLGWSAVAAGFRQLADTFREVRRLKTVFLFLLAYWLYIDAVDTVIRMAVDYGLSLGFQSKDLILALLITQFVGFPAAILFGALGSRIGAKRGILLGIAVYLGVTVWAYFLSSPAEFYGLAVTIGLVQGGVQALSRSLYASIIPKARSAEFFGFYNMLGKFAAVVGPTLMGWVGVLTGEPRFAILSLSALFLGGAVLLCFVREEEGIRAAREYG